MTTGDQNHALALAIIERKHAEIAALTQRAEAAEAERDDARLDLAEAAQHIGKGDAFRATLRAELEAVRAQRDAMDKLWADAVRELQKVDDERIQIRAERDALLVINGDLARDNETMEAERDALRKDAARLDWLSAQSSTAVTFWPHSAPHWIVETSDTVQTGDTLRVALDAALAVQPTTGEGNE